MSHVLRQPNYVRSTGQFAREEKLPLCKAAASLASPPSPLAAAALWAQGRVDKEGRLGSSSSFVTNTASLWKTSLLVKPTEVLQWVSGEVRFPYLLALWLMFPTHRLLGLRPIGWDRDLSITGLENCWCVPQADVSFLCKTGDKWQWPVSQPRVGSRVIKGMKWTILRLIFLFFSKINISETKGLSTNMDITLSSECKIKENNCGGGVIYPE